MSRRKSDASDSSDLVHTLSNKPIAQWPLGFAQPRVKQPRPPCYARQAQQALSAARGIYDCIRIKIGAESAAMYQKEVGQSGYSRDLSKTVLWCCFVARLDTLTQITSMDTAPPFGADQPS